jgi:hypothetical protein
MGAALAPDEEVEIVENEALRGHLRGWRCGPRVSPVLCVGVAVAAMTQL